MHAHTQKNTHTQTHISQRANENWAVKRLGSIYQTNIWNTGSISVARHCYQELQVGNQVDSPRNYVSLYPCQHILGEKKEEMEIRISILQSQYKCHSLVFISSPKYDIGSLAYYRYLDVFIATFQKKFLCLLTKYIFVCFSVSLAYCARQQLDFWTKMLVLIYCNTNLPLLSGWGTNVCIELLCIILCWI